MGRSMKTKSPPNVSRGASEVELQKLFAATLCSLAALGGLPFRNFLSFHHLLFLFCHENHLLFVENLLLGKVINNM